MPDWTPALASRLSTLGLAPAREGEIIDELSQHLDDRYDELRGAGASDEDAMRLALDEINDEGLLAREMRPLKRAAVPPPLVPGMPCGNWLRDAAHDVRYAARALRHAGGWAAVVVLLLAVGIGANTALYSATDALLIASVPVKDPGSLVRFRWVGRDDMVTQHDEYGYNRPAADGQETRSSFSYEVFRALAAGARDTVDLLTCAPIGQVNVVIDGQAEFADGFVASGHYFDVLGVAARAGRVFTPDDDRPSAPPVAVISSRYWESRFGGDPGAIGKVIKASGMPITIVGVLPPDFTGVQQPLAEPPDISFPLALNPQMSGNASIGAASGRSEGSLLTQPTAWWLEVIGRLRPGVTVSQVQTALDGVFKRTARANFDAFLQTLTQQERASSSFQNRRDVPQLMVESGRRGVYDVEKNAVMSATLLSAVAAVVLLIVCANVANLMLSRAVVRSKEVSIRLSLGATRARLVRQLLTEAVLLASAGALLGLLVASWGVQLLPPPVSSVSIFHGRVLLFTVAATVFTSLLFGVVPALRATRLNVNSALKATGRAVVGRRSLLARTLLVVQVALSLVLLVGAGLFLRTLSNLRSVDVGFNPQNLLLVRLRPQASGYDQPRTVVLYRTLIERLAAVPGVRGAALSQPALLAGGVWSTSIYVDGRPTPADPHDAYNHDINNLVVSPDFFRVMGISILRGRALTEHDDRSAPRVTVINEAAARAYFPNENPIGQRFGTMPDKTSAIEIVGVVRDAKYSSVRESPPPTMYDTYMQSPRAVAVIELRTADAPSSVAAAVRRAIHDVDPNLPVADFSTQVEQIERRLAQERLFAQAYGLFGGVAVLLASVGLFGLMSYSVARRTGEMGIRMALGAERANVMRMVMRESMQLVIVGVVAGLIVAMGAARFVATLLFGVHSNDPATMALAVGVMVAVSAFAAYVPARRASRVDPMVALRYE